MGIFGLWRGASFIGIIKGMEDAELVAICDRDSGKLDNAAKYCDPSVAKCHTFDELLDCDLDGVLLCNYFHEHAEFAIRAMHRGVHVFSECTAGGTLRDCVLLCEAVEETGMKYMLAENYPFSAAGQECAYVCKEGTLGKILYAEGEYNHTGTREELIGLTPGKYHWRAWMPRPYYITHALGPLMYATGHMPIRVSAFAVHSDVLEQYDDARHNYDAFAMMNCPTDGGALFRCTGSAHMGSASGYRIVGENGCVETGRTLGGNVNVSYHHWLIPEDKQENQTYKPKWRSNGRLAEGAGHGGGDFWTVYNFIRYIRDDVVPFFDVYRACCMSAVAIYGWRSCLENGKPYDIPNFRDKAARDAIRDDALTPFPDENGNNISLPCATKAAWKKK